jgi:hypothetical protein
MVEENGARNQSDAAIGIGSRIKQAALAALFSTILLIPRLRRMRRQVALWTVFRLMALFLGGALVWLHLIAGWGSFALACGIVLATLGLLVHARPLQKSLDDCAREFGALVVINGGRFSSEEGRTPGKDADMFVCPDQLVVKEKGSNRLTRVPFASVHDVACRANEPSKVGDSNEIQWEVVIPWGTDPQQMARFVFQGTFAEHLARVAQSTVRSQWKKELPVLTS